MKLSFSRVFASLLALVLTSGALLAQNRTISAVVSGNAITGTGSAALVLASQGNEQGVGFSVTFDTAKLKYEGFSNGSGLGTANLQYNDTQAASGRIGVAVAFSGSTTFAAGNRELVVLNFSVLSGGSTTIDFGNVPVVKEVVDAGVNELAVTYVAATITAATTTTTTPVPAISSATSATATVGTAFSYQITASNNPTSYAATGLPAGLSLNATSGQISGTPTTAGSSSVSVTATNAGGTSTAVTLALTVNPPAPVISSATSATATVGTAFSYQITASNSPTSYAATGLPAGLSLNTATGAISGTPTAAGSSNVSLTATNAGGSSTAVTLALTVNSATVVTGRTISAVVSGNAITGTGSAALVLASQGNEQGVGFSVTFDTAKLKYEGFSNGSGLGTANLQYNDTQAASGRIGVAVAFSGSTTFAAGSRELVVLNFSVLSGGSTTIDFGNVPVVKEVVDAGVNELAVTYVAATLTAATTTTTTPVPVISSATTATATVGTAFSYQITASNNPTSYAATGLPTGLTLNTTTGLISGTPTAAGSSNVSLTATNTGGVSTVMTLNLTVNPAATAPSITTQPQAQTVTAGASATFSVVASGTAPLSYQWVKGTTDIASATTASYTIASATSADAGSYTVKVSNSAGNVTSNAATLTVNPAAIAPSITTQPQSQTVTAGNSATFSVVASGTTPLSYQWVKGTTDIANATNATYTIASAVSADAGSYKVKVSNSAGNVTSNTAILSVNPPPPVINSATTASATVGEAFNYQITASDPSASFAATNLPAGLTLNQVSGVISGVPTTAGTKQVTIVASNSGGNSPAFTLALTVKQRELTVTLQGAVAKVYDGTDVAFIRAANYQIGGLLPNDAITIAKTAGTYASAAAGGTLLDVEGVVRSWSMDPNKQGAFVNGTQYFVWTRITAGLGQYAQTPTPPTSWGKALNISGFSSLGGETGVTFKFGDLFLNESAFISGKDGANGGITVQEYVPQTGVATPVEFYDTAGALLAAGTMEKLVTRVAYTTGIATGEGRFTLNAAGTSAKSAAFMQELAQVTGGTGRLNFFISSYVAITGNTSYADYRSTGVISASSATGKAVTVSLASGDFAVGQGTSLSNYTLPTTATGAVGVIAKAPLTAKADNKVRTLGAANPPLTITYVGFVPGETKSAITEPAISTSANEASQLGDYAITLTGGSAANYNLTLQYGTLSVVAKTVPVIEWAPTGPIVYGTPLGNGQLNATAKTPAGASLPGSFAYTPASGTVLNAGEQTLSVTFTPNDEVQYAPATVTKTLTVSPKALALALKGTVTKVYDGTPSATLQTANYELTGFVGTENATVTKTMGGYDSAAAGTAKTVSVTSLGAQDFSPGQGTVLSNYILPTSASGAVGEISRKMISAVVQGPVSKTYDGTTAATLTSANYVVAGFVNGESATVNQPAGAFDTAAAGTSKTVTATLAAGNFSAGANTVLTNYTLPPSATGTVGVVEKKSVTGSFTAANKVYDGTVAASVSQPTVNGAVQGDDVSLSGGTAAFGSATAGNGKTVTLSGASLSGAKASNYTLSSVATAVANITPKQLTVTNLSAGNKPYDGSATAVLSGNASLSGVIFGDDVSLAGTASAVFANSNAGTAKAVTVSGLSLNGAAKDNYSLAPLSLTADITKATLTVKAEDRSKGYDGQVFAASGHAVTYAGFIPGETASVLGGTLNYGGAAAAAVNVGQHAITPAGLTSNNYAIIFADGTLTINRRPLSIRANDDSKVYGTAKTYGTSIAFTSQGLVSGQSIGSVTITPSGGATAASPVGSYDLVPSAATGGTFLASNYDITYQKGSLSVSSFTVTGSFVATNKTYDGTTVASVTSRSLTGVRSGDVVELTGGTAAFESAGVGSGKRVVLTGATLTGANAGNYVLSSVSSSSANITAKELTVGGLSASDKIYDGAIAATITGTPVLQGKVGSDDVVLSGSPAGAFANAGAGSGKAVAVSGLSLSGAAAVNYTLTVPSLSANVTKANQTLTIVSVLQRAASDPDFTIDVSATSKLTAFTYSSSNPAVATISASGVIDLLTQGTTTITVAQPGDANFNAGSVTGSLTVVASGQTLVWDASGLSGKKFGDAPITLSATASSNLPVTFTSSNAAVASISGNTLTITGAGTADIIAAQVGNATFGAAEKKVTMTVAKAPATVTLSNLTATYDGTPKAVSAVTAPSGLKVNLLYGVAPGMATAPTSAGTYAISATIDENNYSGGDSSKTLVIAKAAQTIAFTAPATKSVADPAYPLSAAATSGLPVSYVSSNPLVASVVGNTVTPRAAGSVTITARQGGNENYSAATDVGQALTVEPLLPDFTIPAASAVALQGGSFLFGPVSLNPLSAPATFSASANLPAGLKIDAATGNISGVPTAGTGTPISVTITATNSKGSSSKSVSILVQPPAPVITSAAAAVATAGQAFTYQTIATPLSGLTYAVSPSSAPAGWNALAISGSGVLTGTPVAGGTYVFTITATNATGSASLPLVVTVALPPDAPSYGGITNPSATAGTAFSFAPNFGTSAQPTTYALSGTLPTGLNFSAGTGVISGTTQVTGSFPISITATRGLLSATANLTLVVNPAANAPVAIVGGGSVRTATVGSLFSVTVTADPEPTGFTISPAALTEAGLAAGLFNNVAKSIVISGTPTKVGTFQIPIVAQNTAGGGQPTLLVLTVNPHPEAPQVVSTPSVTARVGEPLSPFTLAAKSAGADIAPPNVTYALLGALPAGLGFDGSTGVLSGQPSAGTTGSYKVLFSATKVGVVGATGLGLEVTINVLPPLSVPEITSNGSAAGQVGQAFTYAISATNTPTTFNAAPLPAGLTLNAGLISGVPTTATGASPFKVTLSASNGDGTGNPKELSIAIAPAPATPVVTSALSATGRVGQVFSYKITASESPTSYVALNLPSGLALDVASGQISGSPTQAGTFTTTIRAANAAGLGAAESFAISINPAPSAPLISSAPTAMGEVGVQLSYQISATPAPSSYAVSGALPSGLTLNSTTGLIKGSPTLAGTYAIGVTATGEGGTSLPQSVVFTIKPSALAPLVTSPGTASGNVGSSFSYQIDATNPPLVTRDAVNLPPGLVVNPFTGQITGTPTAVGTIVASLVATNGVGAGPTRDLTIVIGPSLSAPVISGAMSVSGQVGVSFSYGITASGTPTSYELTGAPAWMLLNTTTGVITGMPTAPGNFAVSAVARNAAGVSAPFPMTVNVAPAANTPVITSSQTASGTVGVPFVKYTIASNPQATSYLATGLPPGLSLNGTLGEITGTPTASGTYPVSIFGTNANGQGATVKVTITISPSITFGN